MPTTENSAEIEKVETPQKRRRTLPPALRERLWKPGQSGNPSGRPRKITNHVEKLLSAKLPNDKRQRTYLQALAEEALKRAIKRSDKALEQIWDRVEGRVPLAVTGDGGGPLQMQVEMVMIGAVDVSQTPQPVVVEAEKADEDAPK